MAEAKLTRVDVFPTGTSVKAFRRDSWVRGEKRTADPVGITAAATATVAADGSLTFTGLEPDIDYFAGATVNSVYRTIMFRAKGGDTDPASDATPSKVTVTTSDTAVLSANPSRAGVSIVNAGSNPVSLRPASSGAAVAGEGIWLAAGGGSWDGKISGRLWKGRVRGIAVGGSSDLAVTEA